MMFQLDFATITSVIAIIIGLANILRMAVKEGERRESVRRMNAEIESLKIKQDQAAIDNAADGKILASIQATLNALVASVNDMRIAFLQHVSNGIK